MKRTYNNHLLKHLYINCTERKDREGTKLDFFINVGAGKTVYAFSRRYSANVYKKLKNEVRVADVIRLKERDWDIMKMVAHLRRNLPYLLELCDLRSVAA